MTSDNMTPLRGRLFLSLHILFPILLLLITALLFNLFPWDMAVQRYYYRGSWVLDNNVLVRIIYHYGNIPALLVTIGALIVFVHSIRDNSRYRTYRRLSLYLVLAMIVGPGLIVNSLLKDNWGRPRPRDIVEFGGRHQYEAPLRIDPASGGKSFPCGHATMGFYFFAPAFVLMLKRRKWGRALWVFGLLYGLLIGWVRVVQGGHFVSDVIFSGGIVYLSSVLLWRAMKLDKEPLYLSNKSSFRLRLWHKLLFWIIGIMIVITVLIATPYNRKQSPISDSSAPSFLNIELDNARVNLAFADTNLVQYSVNGFGFPGSQALLNVSENDDTPTITQDVRGFYSELNAEFNVIIDTLNTTGMRLRLSEGEVRVSAIKMATNNLGIAGKDEPFSDSASYQIRADNVIYESQNNFLLDSLGHPDSLNQNIDQGRK